MKLRSVIGGVVLLISSFGAVGQISDEASNNPSNGAISSVPSNYQFPGAPTATNGVLFNSGPLITHPAAGPGGEDVSVLQNNSLGMSTLGLGHQVSAGNRIADDFTVSDPYWDIEEITFYAYQTGETASTITAVNLRIWDGPPGQPGSNIVFGDDTTNRMTSTVYANTLRAVEGSPYPTNRQIAASTVAVNTRLNQGTYWLDWQSDGSGSSGPWAPPITILGQTSTGNAMQFTPGGGARGTGGAWNPVLDGGTNTPQGFPFVVTGQAIIPQIPASNRYTLLFLFAGLGTLAVLSLYRRRAR